MTQKSPERAEARVSASTEGMQEPGKTKRLMKSSLVRTRSKRLSATVIAWSAMRPSGARSRLQAAKNVSWSRQSTASTISTDTSLE